MPGSGRLRFAPTYDAVTTEVFQGLEDDRLALSLAGKRTRLSSTDFVPAGVTMGISAEWARNIVESLCDRLSTCLSDLGPETFGVPAVTGRGQDPDTGPPLDRRSGA